MRLWFRVLLLSCVVTAVLIGSLGAEQTTRVGRWVNVDVKSSNLIVLDVEPDGTVHHLIPAPQFAATYRVNADRVQLTQTVGPLGVPKGDKANLTLVIKGDTLLDENGKPLFTRFLDAPRKQDSIQGTWRHVVSKPIEQFMTFRSDGQVVLEVGVTGSVTLTGDTLKITRNKTSDSFAVRLVGETLYVETPGKQQRFVRRPWGCLGMIEFDANASECR
jgi:hypothetical protein